MKGAVTMQRSKTLTASDILVIEKEVKTLPGRWQVDSVIDLKRPGKPRVWVRDSAGIMPPINFERVGNAIWVSCCEEGQHDASSAISAAFMTIPAAFIYIGGQLRSASPIRSGGVASTNATSLSGMNRS
jgi:hypothetical protein